MVSQCALKTKRFFFPRMKSTLRSGGYSGQLIKYVINALASACAHW